MALDIAPATGDQNTTQNPQTVPTQTLGGASAKSGGVQPGTAASLLTSSQGEYMGSPAITTVSLGAAGQTQAATQAPSDTTKPVHHTSAAWFVVPVALCLVAVVMFWTMTRTAKSTTD
ncbi:MAG: hypothetical protein ACREJM_02095 [Candidatus Saccharimonadales bacterium]